MEPVMRDPGDRFFMGRGVRGLTLRLYRDRDEFRVSPRADFAAAYNAAGKRLPDGPKWTLLDGDRVLGVGGVEPLGDQTWGGWAYLSDLTPRQWVFARIMARIVLGYVQHGFRARRIQVVAAPRPGAVALLAKVGFEAEHEDDGGHTLMTLKAAA